VIAMYKYMKDRSELVVDMLKAPLPKGYVHSNITKSFAS